jgi:hypothetical protein
MLTVLPHQVLSGKRFGPSTTTSSGTTHGTETNFTTMGTLSAATPQDIARLEEGKRTRQAFKFITNDLLNTAQPGQVPDWIQVSGTWFEVSFFAPWNNGVMIHNEFIITKIENAQDYA